MNHYIVLRIFLISAFLVLQQSIFSQIKFEKGYIITDDNERIDCEIKNLDWKNNPEKIQYKKAESENSSAIFLKDLVEFAIPGKVRFVRKKVMIDRSPEKLDELTTKRGPVWSEEVLMLKVLVEGAATLMVYEDNKMKRFFFQYLNSDIEQLIHKTFLAGDKRIFYNNDYQQQLRLTISCSDLEEIDYTKIKYETKNLVEYFESYNECVDSEVISYLNKNKKLWNIKLSTGIAISSLEIINKSESSNEIAKYNFDSQFDYRIGAELELILPFHQNKWSILTKMAYQDYKASMLHGYYNIEASYSFFDFLFGVRHYFYLSQPSKLFITSGTLLSLPERRSLKFHYLPQFDISQGFNFYTDLGIEFNKVSIICAYSFSRNLLNRYHYFDAYFSTFSVSLGYKLF